jgi:uncharacterized protein (TIGR03435 family)
MAEGICLRLLFTGTLVLSFAAVLGSVASAQSPGPPPAFVSGLSSYQVATIKPSRPNESTTIQIRGRNFVTTATSLLDILKYCYGLHASQIVDGPLWMATTRFDIVAEPSGDVRPSSDQLKILVQGLLAERFQLKLQPSTRKLSVLAIDIAKGGPKLTKSTRDPSGIPAVSYTPGWLSAWNSSIGDFAAFLQRYVTDRPVVDQTSLVGKYDMVLKFLPDESGDNDTTKAGEDANSLPGLYTAMQEELGLKLRAAKLSTQVMIVERVALPSAN